MPANYHSPDPGLAEFLRSLHFAAPAFPVVSNVTAQPVTDPAEARERRIRPVTAPVGQVADIEAIGEARRA